MADRHIEAILFDLDGVLVNARDWHFEAFNRALVAFGYTPVHYTEHLKRYDGLPTLKKLALLSAEQSIPSSRFAEIAEAKQRLTIALVEEKCIPSPAHVEMLERLRQKGYRMAVCSNSVRASVDLLLGKTALMPFFEFTLSSEDVRNPKPDPEIYLAALRRLGVAADHTLILEDNINGINAARASGAYVKEIRDIEEVSYTTVMDAIAHIESRHE